MLAPNSYVAVGILTTCGDWEGTSMLPMQKLHGQKRTSSGKSELAKVESWQKSSGYVGAPQKGGSNVLSFAPSHVYLSPLTIINFT